MHTELLNLREAFQKSGEDLKSLLEPLDNETLNQKPEPKKWSAAECIAHLIKTGREVAGAIESTIDKSTVKGRKGDPPFHYGWFNRLFIRSMEPDSKMKSPSPKVYKPIAASGYDKEELRQEYLDVQERYCRLLEQSNGLDLKRVKVRSPAVAVLRLSLGATFHAMETHQRRHLEQARRSIAAAK
jgi:hypothetical protein